MDSAIRVILAAAAFVGAHLLMSHPLRAPLVARFGDVGFAGLDSLIAFATFGWLCFAYRAAPFSDPLWSVGGGPWVLVSLVMLLASVLLLGSLIRNPAMTAPKAGLPEPRGVFAITRHPMMWSFALWSLRHIAVFPYAKNIAVCLAILILALLGSALQHMKKRQTQPDFWPKWQAKTSWPPFAAIAAGRARFGGFRMHELAGGLVVWLAATWAHMPLSGYPAGLRRWL